MGRGDTEDALHPALELGLAAPGDGGEISDPNGSVVVRLHVVDDLAEIGEVEVEPHHALVCVVGRGMAAEFGVAAKVLTVLAEAGVPVRVISQGAVKVNIALVVAEEHLERAIQALHGSFFAA